MFSFFRILESAKDVVRLLLASRAIHPVTHGGSPAPQAQIWRYMVSSPPGARDRPATATSSRRKFVLDSVIPFYDDASTGPSRDPSSPRHTRTSPICIHVRPIRAPTATRGLACVALPQCVSRDALLETRFSRHVPAHDRASRGSHVRPASRGFAPDPPSRLSEDPMGMIRPGKGARSDRPVPRAQHEWRQSGASVGGRGWRDNVRRRANRDPPQASTHRHILHHVRVTIYKITPAITGASARHGTSSSVSAL